MTESIKTNDSRTFPLTFEGRILPRQDEAVFDQGLTFDIDTLVSRRRALSVLGAGVGLVTLGGLSACGTRTTGGVDLAAGGVPLAAPSFPTQATCTNVPEETAGPYPGDGSNGPNALTSSGIVRSDITTSYGAYSGTAPGIRLTFSITLVDTANGCTPLVGAAVYAWQCDRSGQYSLYTVANQNYLRGVQVTDATGTATFTSIYPGCYSGRWPHIHFEVFKTLALATTAGSRLATSQLALPDVANKLVYASSGYESSLGNYAGVSLSTDNVFREDGGATQIPVVTGSVAAGFDSKITVGVSSSGTGSTTVPGPPTSAVVTTTTAATTTSPTTTTPSTTVTIAGTVPTVR